MKESTDRQRAEPGGPSSCRGRIATPRLSFSASELAPSAARHPRSASAWTALRGVAALAVASLVVFDVSSSGAVPPLYTDAPAPKAGSRERPVSMRAFADLARTLSPAVVNIVTTRRGASRLQMPGRPDGAGLGSGFIVRADGLVLTNHHVIRGADAIQVRLTSDSTYEATVAGTFPLLDVALLKFEPAEPLVVAPLGDSRRLEIGEWVIAIGNPFGLSHTVTAGIVSAKGRRDVVPGREANLARFIQTDASINPGNSGGPLIDVDGAVVGINTAINAAGQGIGFAIPIDMVKKVLPQLAEGRVSRSYLGVRFSNVPPEIVARARARNLVEGRRIGRGAFVREVLPEGPAAAAGLAEGDIIVAWGGNELADWEEVSWLAATAGAGQRAVLTVVRGERELQLQVVLGTYPEQEPESAPAPVAPSVPAPDLGVSVGPVPSAAVRRLGLEPGRGVVVTRVAPRSPGAAIGLAVGDVVERVNGELIEGGREDFERKVQAVGRGELLALEVRRGDARIIQAFTR